jgi:peptidoglycan hydrolase-like protein with peptidoglycan-binding domain
MENSEPGNVQVIPIDRFPVLHSRFPVLHGLEVAVRRSTIVLLATLLLAACNSQSAEERARETQEKIMESIPDVVAKALAQKTTPEDVKQAQQALTAVNEYMGPVDGKLDGVTVNSIQAFQRSHGLTDDGILTEKTKRLLADSLAKK